MFIDLGSHISFSVRSNIIIFFFLNNNLFHEIVKIILLIYDDQLFIIFLEVHEYSMYDFKLSVYK